MEKEGYKVQICLPALQYSPATSQMCPGMVCSANCSSALQPPLQVLSPELLVLLQGTQGFSSALPEETLLLCHEICKSNGATTQLSPWTLQYQDLPWVCSKSRPQPPLYSPAPSRAQSTGDLAFSCGQISHKTWAGGTHEQDGVVEGVS